MREVLPDLPLLEEVQEDILKAFYDHEWLLKVLGEGPPLETFIQYCDVLMTPELLLDGQSNVDLMDSASRWIKWAKALKTFLQEIEDWHAQVFTESDVS